MPDVSYYNKLYPLQDAALEVLKGVTSFYLTGRTAVSRFHYHHRYSEDLDFFMNHSKDFRDEAKKLIAALESGFSNVQVIMDMESFFRIFVTDENGTVLKVELINDVGFRYGKPKDDVKYHLIDIPRNILSNKPCALSRNAAKDVSDIITICQHERFTWPELFEEAKLNDTWANEISAISTLSKMSTDKILADVDCIEKPTALFLEESINAICTDIAQARENSLYHPS